jgi:hypothetical protein
MRLSTPGLVAGWSARTTMMSLKPRSLAVGGKPLSNRASARFDSVCAVTSVSVVSASPISMPMIPKATTSVTTQAPIVTQGLRLLARARRSVIES